MKTILDQPEEEIPPLDPKKVVLFAVLLLMIAFAGWRFLRARKAVAEVAEASKDYRKLFPARSAEPPAAPVPLTKPVAAAEAPMSGIGLLKVDDDMRQPKRAPAEEPPPPQAEEEAPPPAPAAAAPAAPAKPAKKAFVQPRLNAGAFSGLNGGSGIGFSGGSAGGGGAAPAPAAAPAMPAIPGLPASDKK